MTLNDVTSLFDTLTLLHAELGGTWDYTNGGFQGTVSFAQVKINEAPMPHQKGWTAIIGGCEPIKHEELLELLRVVRTQLIDLLSLHLDELLEKVV